uniref:Uncharacterized protein n=1 Tax=Pipistrellus kuhlii TaxID=59472 RepID=A0A7J7VBI2_PIPKU|nr:hypothetical protein mPipKuh1_008511 [Pipistrellus kuhlii]
MGRDRCGEKRLREAGKLILAPGHWGPQKARGLGAGLEDDDSAQNWSPGCLHMLFSHLAFWKPASSISQKTLGPVCLSAHWRDIQGQLSRLPAKPCWEKPQPHERLGLCIFKDAGSLLPAKGKLTPPAHPSALAAFPWKPG